MIDPLTHLTKRLRQIAHALSIHSRHIQENYQITIPQLICLREIRERGPLSLGTLAICLFINNSTVTGIVDRLEKRRFVRRVRQSHDRRKIHVKITPQGADFIENTPDPLEGLFVARLKALESKEFKKILWAIDTLAVMMNPTQSTNSDNDDDVKDLSR